MSVNRPFNAKIPTVPPTSAQSTSQSINLLGSVMCGRICLCSMIRTRLLSSSLIGRARTARQQSWKTLRCATRERRAGRLFFRCAELSALTVSLSDSPSDEDESKTPVDPSARSSTVRFFGFEEAAEAALTTGVAQNHSLSSEAEVGMVVRDSRAEMVLEMRWAGRGGGATFENLVRT